MLRKTGLAAVVAGIVFLAGCGDKGATGATGPSGSQGPAGPSGSTQATDVAAAYTTASPIKHVVIIFGENISFDHYFATYPSAANPAGQTAFKGKAPASGGVNNLSTP